MSRKELNAYRLMWLFVFFDLPTGTPKERKAYQKFRKYLLQEGFNMMQFSVYIRHCLSWEKCKIIEQRLRTNLPPAGVISVLPVTDKQFGKMGFFIGKTPSKRPDGAGQLLLF